MNKRLLAALAFSALAIFAMTANKKEIYPDRFAVIFADQAEAIVSGIITESDDRSGFGTIMVREILKGRLDSSNVSVIASGPPRPRGEKGRTSLAPRYVHAAGLEGIFLLFKKDESGRYDLCRNGAYFSPDWKWWFLAKIDQLGKRAWSQPVNGIACSVIIAENGKNDSFRYFSLCIRNDSPAEIMIRVNYRTLSNTPPENMYQASVAVPGGATLDMIKGDKQGRNRATFTGAPSRVLSSEDFKSILPGGKIYLPVDSLLSCFFPDSVPGTYVFKASYLNDRGGADFGFTNVWKGRVDFPPANFHFDRNRNRDGEK